MVIGVPTEIKTHEYRVALTPAGARTLVEDGHQVLVQAGAGLGSGIGDEEYRRVGAELVESAADVFAAELMVKVKEPLAAEYDLLRPEQILFTFLHLAPARELTQKLLEREVAGVAYETIELADGSLPLLQPMSEVAGRMAVQVGAHYLQKENGGRGVLLAGAPGVKPGKVLIVGAGTVGRNAVRIAAGMGADVRVMDVSPARLAWLDDHYGNRISTLMSNSQNIEDEILDADLFIGAVLTPGARAPRLVGRELLARMNPGSVIVDVAVDQGGCVETIRPTTHDAPVYEVDGVIHYGVANMPGAVSRTSTFALTNSTLPYLRKIADQGLAAACRKDEALRRGVNTLGGTVRNRPVAEALNLEFQEYWP
ncbi:alanine dehydrogenase [Geoalkalibacter ferrihydriticus]|uniref:Alanine dehydrogenase n=2 Tax=Geoalkalibacter ferrihydriticus TaxID=392333 RepID=A0A0C2HML4_9BACT|nr:alanine dehydrogenase [Geoalkalibacter ferrihydriticus]KIH76160.1 alanine dehydrogenase [Geoalkalibacter ferrihydriticus DSM 17813]SDM41910.1 alanine dehydrogenase [Geoalkalibacter ferrihydriticus]